jgi:Cytochrome b5-like Heme/Steroid binding domain
MYIKYILSAVGVGIVIAAIFLLVAPSPQPALVVPTVATSTENQVPTSSAPEAIVAPVSGTSAPAVVPIVSSEPTPVQPPVGENKPVPTPQPAAVGISASEVAQHASRESCWSIINSAVYDLTSFISKHPGGASKILAICGKDGTASFMDQHGGERKPESILVGLKVGDLAP